MTETHTAPVSELEHAQLFAHAENSLSVALYHLRLPAANVPGAARNAVRALAALNRLRTFATEAAPDFGSRLVENGQGVRHG